MRYHAARLSLTDVSQTACARISPEIHIVPPRSPRSPLLQVQLSCCCCTKPRRDTYSQTNCSRTHMYLTYTHLTCQATRFNPKVTPRSSPCRQAQRYLRIPYRFTQLSRHPEVVLRRAGSQCLGVKSSRHTLASFTKTQRSSKHVGLFESVTVKSVTPATAHAMSASVHKE
jgi:hypothetical protein